MPAPPRGPENLYITAAYDGTNNLGIVRTDYATATFMGFKALVLKPSDEIADETDNDVVEEIEQSGENEAPKGEAESSAGDEDESQGTGEGGARVVNSPQLGGGSSPSVRLLNIKGQDRVTLYLKQGTQLWAPTKALNEFAPGEPIEFGYVSREQVYLSFPGALVNEAGEFMRPYNVRNKSDGEEKRVNGQPVQYGLGITYALITGWLCSAKESNSFKGIAEKITHIQINLGERIPFGGGFDIPADRIGGRISPNASFQQNLFIPPQRQKELVMPDGTKYRLAEEEEQPLKKPGKTKSSTSRKTRAESVKPKTTTRKRKPKAKKEES